MGKQEVYSKGREAMSEFLKLISECEDAGVNSAIYYIGERVSVNISIPNPSEEVLHRVSELVKNYEVDYMNRIRRRIVKRDNHGHDYL